MKRRGPKTPLPHAFKPGQSGNPGGKPKGAKDWRTQIGKQLIENSREAVKKVVDMALEGNERMLELYISKIMPNMKGSFLGRGVFKAVTDDVNSLADSSAGLTKALEQNVISTEAAQSAQSILEGHARILNAVNLEGRIKSLEEKLENK